MTALRTHYLTFSQTPSPSRPCRCGRRPLHVQGIASGVGVKQLCRRVLLESLHCPTRRGNCCVHPRMRSHAAAPYQNRRRHGCRTNSNNEILYFAIYKISIFQRFKHNPAAMRIYHDRKNNELPNTAITIFRNNSYLLYPVSPARPELCMIFSSPSVSRACPRRQSCHHPRLLQDPYQ